MKIELGQIIDQLSEALDLPLGQKVAAMVENDGTIVGWTVVNVCNDGTISPNDSSERYACIKEMLDSYAKLCIGP